MFEPNVVIWPFFETETVQDRRNFTVKVFLEFLVFLIVGLVQWIIAVTTLRTFCTQLTNRHFSALFLGFVLGLFIFLIFALSKPLRRKRFFNWILTMVIVELLIVGIVALLKDCPALHLLIAFMVASVIFLFVIILAASMPTDITAGGLYIYLMALGFYLLSLYGIVVYCILEWYWGFCIFALAMDCVVSLFLTYHVQCIMGGRASATKVYDDKFAAMLLFIEFIALFAIALFIRPVNITAGTTTVPP